MTPSLSFSSKFFFSWTAFRVTFWRLGNDAWLSASPGGSVVWSSRNVGVWIGVVVLQRLNAFWVLDGSWTLLLLFSFVKLSDESLQRQPEEVFDLLEKLGEGYGSVRGQPCRTSTETDGNLVTLQILWSRLQGDAQGVRAPTCHQEGACWYGPSGDNKRDFYYAAVWQVSVEYSTYCFTSSWVKSNSWKCKHSFVAAKSQTHSTGTK